MILGVSIWTKLARRSYVEFECASPRENYILVILGSGTQFARKMLAVEASMKYGWQADKRKEITMTTKKEIVFVLTLATASLSAGLAQAHTKIEAAEPKADSALNQAPKEIRLHFSDALEPAFTRIVLLDANNVAVKLPKADVDKIDAKMVSAKLPVLRAGQYLVRWSTMTRDSHKVKGEYRFTVR